jgi:hypothetical protein
LDELHLLVGHGAGVRPVALHELVAMVDGARRLAQAALVHRIGAAIEEGEDVFRAALTPGPTQHKARVCAHLLRHFMTEIESGRLVIPVAAVPAAPAEASARAPGDASAPAASDASPPAAPPAPPAKCPGAHPDDIFCDICEDAWNARQQQKPKSSVPSSPAPTRAA